MREWKGAVDSDLRKLWRAVEQSPSTVLITDSQARIEYVNPKFEELTGYAAAEVLGENPRILNSGKQPPEFYQRLWDTITAGRVWRGEFCNRKKNGDYYWEFAAISAVRNADGEITHYVGVKEDITARKEVEEQLENAIRELRAKNTELERAMRELKDTQIELVETERIAVVGKLTAGLTHEINTPLGVLISSVGINDKCLQKILDSISGADKLEDVLNDEHYQKSIDTLRETGRHSQIAASRIREVVRCLKDFVRLDEAGWQMVDVRNGIEDTLTLLQHRIVDGIHIAKELSDVPRTYCNPAEINQAVLIILSNAIDAVGDQGEVALRSYEKGGSIYIEIEDNGKGIAPDHQKRIFDFSFTRKGGRIGFGFKLPSAVMVVRRHGGDINVESELGKGSTFTIGLPVRES